MAQVIESRKRHNPKWYRVGIRHSGDRHLPRVDHETFIAKADAVKYAYKIAPRYGDDIEIVVH